MSKSRKKTSIGGITTSCSEKQDKRIYNRRYRHAYKQILNTNFECELLPHLREYSNVWSMDKDGKVWFDAKEFPKLMRK
jgi:hypothetical protein